MWLNYTGLRNKVKAVTRRARKVREMDVEVYGIMLRERQQKKTKLPELFIDHRDHSKGMAESDKQTSCPCSTALFFEGDK